MQQGIIVDNFAGGGGASTGIEAALGQPIDVAINHDAEAVAMHKANHPHTEHICQSVWKADPRDVVKGRPVRLAWFSPDCKHFSKAKGGKPVEHHIRDLAWVVVHWAKLVRPAVIMLENVEEFRKWGPLVDDGEGNKVPCPDREGFTFRRWRSELVKLGYKVEDRELRACDYGAPTIRKRLFVIARCDGLPIVWPKPTHRPQSVSDDGIVTAWAKGHGLTLSDLQRLPAYRTAAECIDWNLPCPSIFERKRPLADATLRRIARGIMRYVVNSPAPFIVGLAHGEHARGAGARSHGMDEPLRTIHAGGGNHALCTPFVTKFRTGATGQRMDDPLCTVTANSFIKRAGGAAPIGLVAPILAGCGGRAGQSPEKPANVPMNTMTSKADQIIVAPTLIQTGYGEDKKRNGGAGQPPRSLDLHKPLGTQMAGGVKHALVASFLAKHYGGHETDGAPMQASMSTVTARDHHALVAASLLNMKGSERGGRSAEEPAPTQCAAGNHIAEVRAFLIKYFGTDQDPRLEEPMHTTTTKHRFGLVTVEGVDYQIVDIGMRMLEPRELFNAQGFPRSYIIDPAYHGKPMTKTAQVKMCGNSVCPPIAEALVRANFAAELAMAAEAGD